MTKEKGFIKLPSEAVRSNDELVREILQDLAQKRAAPGYRSPVAELRWYTSTPNHKEDDGPTKTDPHDPSTSERCADPISGTIDPVSNAVDARPAQDRGLEGRSTRGICLASRPLPEGPVRHRVSDGQARATTGKEKEG